VDVLAAMAAKPFTAPPTPQVPALEQADLRALVAPVPPADADAGTAQDDPGEPAEEGGILSMISPSAVTMLLTGLLQSYGNAR